MLLAILIRWREYFFHLDIDPNCMLHIVSFEFLSFSLRLTISLLHTYIYILKFKKWIKNLKKKISDVTSYSCLRSVQYKKHHTTTAKGLKTTRYPESLSGFETIDFRCLSPMLSPGLSWLSHVLLISCLFRGQAVVSKPVWATVSVLHLCSCSLFPPPSLFLSLFLSPGMRPRQKERVVIPFFTFALYTIVHLCFFIF